MGRKVQEIEKEVINAFSSASGFLGYSEVHGRILASLILSEEVLSLEELAKKSGYSASMISLSLDLLEVLGMIRKVKRVGDRKLYIKLEGDILSSIKTALLLKITKGIVEAKINFSDYEKELNGMSGKDKEKLLKGLKRLEKELDRIDKYVNKLSKIKLPK